MSHLESRFLTTEKVILLEPESVEQVVKTNKESTLRGAPQAEHNRGGGESYAKQRICEFEN